MDPVSLAVGAAIFAVGALIGRFLPGRRNRRPKPPKPTCGCGHNISFHEDLKGACRASIPIDKYDSIGEVVGEEYRPCACHRYSGPQPITEFYAPELTDS